MLKFRSIFKALICVIAILVITAVTMVAIANSNVTEAHDDTSQSKTSVATTTIVIETTENSESQTETSTEKVTSTASEKTVETGTEPATESPEVKLSEEHTEIETTVEACPVTYASKDALYSAADFQVAGVIHWGGWRWTYYSEKVLPGGGLDIPGRHNDNDGYVCDENNYICLSSSSLSRGTVIDTPFGKQGKVYDTGCASDVIDVYVSW